MQIQSIVITHEIVVCEMGLPRSYLELVGGGGSRHQSRMYKSHTQL